MRYLIYKYYKEGDKAMKTRKMALAALFAAAISLLAQISIPLPFSPVPITGSLFGIFLAGALLGRSGTVAVITYLLLGAAGLPVFAQARGGLNILIGPTGGYLLGYVLGAYLLGWLVEQKGHSWLTLMAGMCLCLAAVHIIGTIQLALVAGYTFTQALWAGTLPFIPLDLAKAFLTGSLAQAVQASLSRAGLLQSYRH